jgi:hypothetical protein
MEWSKTQQPEHQDAGKTEKISKDTRRSGTVSELIACAWLLDAGYEVFRNVSPHGKADIVALDRKTLAATLYDVKTGSVRHNRNGERVKNKPRISQIQRDKGVRQLTIYPNGEIEIEE